MGPKNPIKSPKIIATISFSMNLEDFCFFPDE